MLALLVEYIFLTTFYGLYVEFIRAWQKDNQNVELIKTRSLYIKANALLNTA